jgi:tetratricopeptide (TPR) repeat protein
MSAEVRPAPASSGQLARTPLPHLLVYAHDRQLTGTFDFRAPDGATASVLVRAGQPAKAQLSTPPIYLGQVLLELGIIDAGTLDESLRAMSATAQRKLHGSVLLDKNAIDRSQLDQGLRIQVLRKVAQLARMPPASVFEFYADWDGLATFGAEPTPIDALSVIWAAIREAPPLDHVKSALERLMQGARLRITKQAQLDRFGFTSEERRWIDLLRMKPLRLDAFFASAEINERITRLIVYCLAITKQVELVGEDAEPSSGNIPAAEPSSSMPQSPRNTVGRVTLRRERVRTQPVVEEKSSPDVLDRRISPSPEAAASPEARRAEINARAEGVDKQNYFEMLGITTEATLEDVKNAYIALAKTWHPDRLPPALVDVKDACARVFARMSEAHQTLTDEDKRKRYLRLMKEGGETPEQQQEIANVLGATVEYQKAEICLRKNDLAQAEVLARHALELDPNQADYVALVAWLEALKPSAQTPEGTQAGIDDLDRALKMNERCERAYFYRAMLYKRQHRNGLAFKDFQKVAELNPKNIDAQRELRLYEMRGGPPRRITPYPSQPAPPKPGLFQKFFKK